MLVKSNHINMSIWMKFPLVQLGFKIGLYV